MKHPFLYKDTATRCLIVVNLLLLAICWMSCQQRKPRQITPAFYYWKAHYQKDSFCQQQQQLLDANTLYCRLFDVDWDESTQNPAPVAPLQATDSIVCKRLIPVIFITNRCLQKMDSGQEDSLAYLISKRIQGMQQNQRLHFLDGYLQVDCDWSAGTRKKYFSILQYLRVGGYEHISATIRLHQVKYAKAAGVPPVERGMLMCYNMGNLRDIQSNNSILDPAVLKQYVANLPKYELPLDVALPLFEWKVWFRNQQYQGLINQLELSPQFATATGPHHYLITKDTLINDRYFKKGDELRWEQSNFDDILESEKIITNRLSNSDCTVALFHLDGNILKKYSTHELETIYGGMR